MASNFDDIVLGIQDAIESVFGHDVVYTLADGTSSTVTGDIQVDADDFAEVDRGEDRVKTGTLNGSTAVFGDWSKGDTVTYEGITWQLDREDGRDAAFVRIRLSQATNTRRVADNERVRRGR